jgi:hypothetical protein
MSFALEKEVSKSFWSRCCRGVEGFSNASYPRSHVAIAKTLVVKLIQKNLNAIVLAIRDGANDVGISGVEVRCRRVHARRVDSVFVG